MKYYLDITLIPNDEVPLYFIWEKLYQQLHLALVERLEDGKSKVGVSFPKYNQEGRSLCNKLRLLAFDKSDLETLNLDKYFDRLSDYAHRTSIKEVPADKITGYAFFKREQVKSNHERLARRRANKMDISGEQALAFFAEKEERRSQLPFIFLNSQTNGNRYPLFIAMEETDEAPSSVAFSSYGLSSNCPVPLF
ncbi:type I-F CRISPR-associated endoribonuclease Cas6/Csy4 [Methylotuvimicrobium sp.]|uniref:type I-F CRISPR-associated endoribonuclease Cas6/Csy4 n=1 Tax=Methylotuvimicrobium sp. TaxID=2822413 RepID=UPI003D64DD7C